jgi:hypothetical protein
MKFCFAVVGTLTRQTKNFYLKMNVNALVVWIAAMGRENESRRVEV